jgi:pimeloyl-ACP methyl ester carboxylesterase
VPPEHAELFNRDIADSRVIMYENVGHLPMQEIPERSAEDLRRFLLEAEPEEGS